MVGVADLGVAMATSRPIQLVHLTDLHLTNRDDAERSEPRVFGRRLKGMNAVFRRVAASAVTKEADVLLVTGDVTDRGDLESWRVFWDALDAANLGKKTFVVPGNNDVGCLGLRRGYGSDGLAHALEGLRLGGEVVGFPRLSPASRNIAILGLNSNNLRGNARAGTATGDLPYFELSKFARLLLRCRDIPVKLVALHHSPNIVGADTARRRGTTTLTTLERLTLQIPQEQRRTFRLLCLSHRVRAVFHGHVHLNEDRRVGGLRIIGAHATTEPMADGSFEFNSYTIRAQGPITKRTHSLTL